MRNRFSSLAIVRRASGPLRVFEVERLRVFLDHPRRREAAVCHRPNASRRIWKGSHENNFAAAGGAEETPHAPRSSRGVVSGAEQAALLIPRHQTSPAARPMTAITISVLVSSCDDDDGDGGGDGRPSSRLASCPSFPAQRQERRGQAKRTPPRQ